MIISTTTIWQADNKVCPLAIPNQISTISIHIPSLVKIQTFTQLKLLVDRHTTDWQTDTWMAKVYPKYSVILVWWGIKTCKVYYDITINIDWLKMCNKIQGESKQYRHLVNTAHIHGCLQMLPLHNVAVDDILRVIALTWVNIAPCWDI